MTRSFFKLSAVGLFGAALGIVAWTSHTLQTQIALYQSQLGFATSEVKVAQPPAPWSCGSFEPPSESLPTKHIQSPRTMASTRTWQMLQKVVSMPFEEETPLSDVFKFIKRSAEESSPGSVLSIYLDPVGLQEADRSVNSSVRLSIEGITLDDSLKLICNQLGLRMELRDNGLVYIDNKLSENPRLEDFQDVLLDQLSMLRTDVASMRCEIYSLRTSSALVADPYSSLGSSRGGLTSGGMCNFY